MFNYGGPLSFFCIIITEQWLPFHANEHLLDFVSHTGLYFGAFRLKDCQFRFDELEEIDGGCKLNGEWIEETSVGTIHAKMQRLIIASDCYQLSLGI